MPDRATKRRIASGRAIMVIPRASTIGTIAHTIIGDINITMGTSATRTGITATAVAAGSGLGFNSIKPKFRGFDGRAWRPRRGSLESLLGGPKNLRNKDK